MEKIIVTGCAGFIGYHVTERLLRDGLAVCGLDNVDAAYDPALKEARLARLRRHPAFTFRRVDVAAPGVFDDALHEAAAGRVVHLAARAGVRASVENPRAFT
jgi:UDP-glucuronate 4-epimerase